MRSGPSRSQLPTLIHDAAAAAFVTDSASFRFLAPFMGRERFASDVAEQLGVTVGAVSYRIRQMLRLGLLDQTGTVARAGRPMRSYRATSDDLFAPLDLTAAPSLGALLRRERLPSGAQIDEAVERAWLRVGRAQHWGTHAYRVPPGFAVNRDFTPLHLSAGATFWDATLADDAPAVWDQITSLSLSLARAKELQRELAQVVDRYAAEPARGEERYLIRLALAPGS